MKAKSLTLLPLFGLIVLFWGGVLPVLAAEDVTPSLMIQDDGDVSAHSDEGEDALSQAETKAEQPEDEATIEKENQEQDAMREMEDQKREAEDIAQGIDNLND